MPRWARSDTLLVRRGVRVALFGLAYVGTPRVTLATNVAHLRFADDSATAARLVPALRKRWHPQLVIEIGHTPAETDSTRHASGDLARLARGVPGVDLWMGGHSHNYVLDEIGGATVMIPGSQGQAVGVCDLTVDPVAGRVVERRARIVSTYADEVTPDSTLAGAGRGLERGRGADRGHAHRTQRAHAHARPRRGVRARRRGGRRDAGRGEGRRGVHEQRRPAGRPAGGHDHQGLGLRGHPLRQHPGDREAHGRRGARHAGGRTGPRPRLAAERAALPLRPRRAPRASACSRSRSPTARPSTTRRPTPWRSTTSWPPAATTTTRWPAAKDQTDTGALVRDALERYLVARTKDGPLDVATDGRIERVGERVAGAAARTNRAPGGGPRRGLGRSRGPRVAAARRAQRASPAVESRGSAA